MKLGAISAGLLLALSATYPNHFRSSFHFGDFHSVVWSPYILCIMERFGSKT